MQVAARIPTWGYRLGAGSIGLPVKYWLVSRAVRRAQKRVSFEFGPFELNEEEARELDLEVEFRRLNEPSQCKSQQYRGGQYTHAI